FLLLGHKAEYPLIGGWQGKCNYVRRARLQMVYVMTRQSAIGPWFVCVFVLATILLTAGQSAVAAVAGDGYQSLAGIRAAVDRFVRERLHGPGVVDAVAIEHLDPRLRLTACDRSLQPFLPDGQPSAGLLTVGVRCPGPKPWRLYVPVRITRHVEVLVAARPIPRGIALTPNLIRRARRDPADLVQAWYTQPKQLLGLETRRAISAGEVFSPQLLASPRLIRRGQELILFAASGAMTVTMKGEALEDGAKGDMIRVRNLSSNRIVEGRVVGADRVRVSL
ncbi:MAG TPA: flagellar basal body P-ring formation chaperone FlgA, partial [Nitrococcus sp.]|nr:flagellar basal body P-ring formation chaperone FlgA [Nitrococcus sp.]